MNAKILVSLFVLIIVGLFVLLAAAGCSNAGPFVTDIAYDGEGNLLVTKNMIVLDAFMGTISNGENPQTIVIKSPKR